jgi:cbb3-type cytochrome oxidase subunit 3
MFFSFKELILWGKSAVRPLLIFSIIAFLTLLPVARSFASSSTSLPPLSTTNTAVPTPVTNQEHPIWQGFNIIGRASGLPGGDLNTLVGGLIRTALSFLGLLLFINIFYAGILWMFSGGNEESTGTAKKIILNSIIGLIIIIFSYSIAAFIIRTFVGAAQGTGSP